MKHTNKLPADFPLWARQGAVSLLASVFRTFPDLNPGTEADHARRFVERAVREAEKRGTPNAAQSILWVSLVELANLQRRNGYAALARLDAATLPEKGQASTPHRKRDYGGKHWTQTPAGRRRMRRIQRALHAQKEK